MQRTWGKRWKSLLLNGLSAVLMVISTVVHADSLPTPIAEPAIPAAVSRAINSLDQQLGPLGLQPGVVGLAVAVAHNDQIVYAQTLGTRRHGGNITVDHQTRFRIASLSKGFASTVAAQLVDEGALGWSEPVADQLDYFKLPDPAQTSAARVEHLLSHQVGLPHYAFDNLFDARWKIPAIFDRYRELPQQCPVGTCYGYQNLSYNAIADLISSRTEIAYEQQVHNRLFSPLRMERANFGLEGLKADGNWAQPHTYRRKQLRRVAPNENYYRLPASAGINASLDDMKQWLLAQLGDRPQVMSSSLLDQLRMPRVQTKREFRGRWRRTRLHDAHYGLGWRIYDYAGEPMIYHAGAVQGYRAQIAVLPQQDVAIVAMWNSESGLPWGITPTFVDQLLGLPAQNWLRLARRN